MIPTFGIPGAIGKFIIGFTMKPEVVIGFGDPTTCRTTPGGGVQRSAPVMAQTRHTTTVARFLRMRVPFVRGLTIRSEPNFGMCWPFFQPNDGTLMTTNVPEQFEKTISDTIGSAWTKIGDCTWVDGHLAPCGSSQVRYTIEHDYGSSEQTFIFKPGHANPEIAP